MSLLYFVSGMFCGTCARAVEGRVRQLPQVATAEISFASKLLSVELKPTMDEDTAATAIEAEIVRGGFGAKRQTQGWLSDFRAQLGQEQARTIPAWLFGLVVFFGMWSSMLAFARYMGELSVREELLLATLSTLLGTPALLLGTIPFARAGLRAAVRAGLPTIDLFVALGSVSALTVSYLNIYSGNSHTFVDSSSMILMVLLAAKLVEARIAGAMAGRILYQIQGEDSLVQRPGRKAVPASQIRRGDHVHFLAGETVALDGKLLSASATLDARLLSGESVPVNMNEGEKVIAGSIALSPLDLIVDEPVGNRLVDGWAESALTSASRPHRFDATLRRIESRLTVLALGGAAALGILRYYQTQNTISTAEAFFVGVLIFCPCLFASVLPLAKQMAHIALARRGIGCQRVEALFDLAAVDRVYLDKTGTLEALESCFVCSDPLLEPKLRQLLDSLRRHSPHPVLDGLAPVNAASLAAPTNVTVQAGQGVTAHWPGVVLKVGRSSFVGGPAKALDTFVSYNGKLIGTILSGSLYQERAKGTLLHLAQILPPRATITVLSGDPRPLQGYLKELAQAGVLTYHGNLSPKEKAHLIEGTSLFVGDGLNDTLALAQARVGIRVGSRTRDFTPVDLYLIEPDLARLPEVIAQARRFVRILIQTGCMAGAYNLVAWSFAAFGWFSPLTAVFAMLSSLILMLLSILRLLPPKRGLSIEPLALTPALARA